MKVDELKKLSDADLLVKLDEIKLEIENKRLAIQNNTFKDTSILSKLRKDTARINTILNERKNNE
jgi:large subunit ribosomal protein L29